MGNANLSGFDRYESLEVERADHSKNYKQEVLEKQAFSVRESSRTGTSW